MEYYSELATAAVVIGTFFVSYFVLSHLGRGEPAAGTHIAGMSANTVSGRRWAPALNVALAFIVSMLILLLLAIIF